MKQIVKEQIKSDLYRYEGCTSQLSFVKCYLSNQLFRFQVALRIRGAGGGRMFENYMEVKYN